MTCEQKQRQLIDLYDTLATWPKPSHTDAFELAPLIHQCLKIITIMCEHDRYVKYIAKNLMLISRAYTNINLTTSVRESLLTAEAEMPVHMRGFSNLFDDVMYENIIRINTQELVPMLSLEHQILAHIFHELIHNFDVYEEFNTICSKPSPHVLALMFLRAFRKIILVLGISEDILEFWLANWGVNKNIISLLYKNIAGNNPCDLSDKDNLILFLCLCNSENLLVSKKIAIRIAQALQDLDFPPLELLIQWGFISVESEN